jgi:membrane protein DedA with SNARE-associated domain
MSAFVHEDLAILAAGFLVVERSMSPWLAGVTVFAGILINNLMWYGLGAGSRRWHWVRRRVSSRGVRRVLLRMMRHLVAAIAIARFGQGTLTPLLFGCGWLRLPAVRVVAVVSGTAAAYVSAMLAVVILFGEVVLRRFGEWAWVVPLALMLAIAVLVRRVLAGTSRSAR